MADPDPAAAEASSGPAPNAGPVSAPSTRRSAAAKSGSSLQSANSGSVSPGSGPAEHMVVRRNSKDKLDNISGFGDAAGQRRSSSSSSIRSRRCSGESVRQIVQLASIKETINSNRSSQQEIESLILAKLTQCRVIFEFDDPLSDLKYKVSNVTSLSHIILTCMSVCCCRK
jgi:hypothetical protein